MPGRSDFVRSALVGLFCAAGVIACVDHPPTGVLSAELAMAKGGNGGGGSGGGATPVVNATDPSSAPQDIRLDVRVLGSNYDDGSTVRFLLNGKGTAAVIVNATRFVSAGELVADVTITIDAIPELYDVEVTSRGGKKGIGIEQFAVTGPTVDIAVAGVSAGDGLYGDGHGFYPGLFVTNVQGTGSGNGSFNMKPECEDGRSVDARLPWAIAGTIPDCNDSGIHVQFHVPGLYFADCETSCPIGGVPSGNSNFSSTLYYYFAVDTNGDGRFGYPKDKSYNVVWTDATFTVVRRATGGAACAWRVTGSTASLYMQSTEALETGGAVALDVTVERDDGVCSGL